MLTDVSEIAEMLEKLSEQLKLLANATADVAKHTEEFAEIVRAIAEVNAETELDLAYKRWPGLDNVEDDSLSVKGSVRSFVGSLGGEIAELALGVTEISRSIQEVAVATKGKL